MVVITVILVTVALKFAKVAAYRWHLEGSPVIAAVGKAAKS